MFCICNDFASKSKTIQFLIENVIDSERGSVYLSLNVREKLSR